MVFFSDTYYLGIDAILKPNVGYYHLYPRLVAYISNLVCSVEYAPHVYNLSALFALYATCFYLFVKIKLPSITKFLMCISITILNNQSEVFMNLTNAQWILALNLIIFIGSREYLQKGAFIIESAYILIISLTGPFSILVLPFLFIRFIQLVIHKIQIHYILLYICIFVCSTPWP
jgi:hypothetical protein